MLLICRSKERLSHVLYAMFTLEAIIPRAYMSIHCTRLRIGNLKTKLLFINFWCKCVLCFWPICGAEMLYPRDTYVPVLLVLMVMKVLRMRLTFHLIFLLIGQQFVFLFLHFFCTFFVCRVSLRSGTSLQDPKSRWFSLQLWM